MLKLDWSSVFTVINLLILFIAMKLVLFKPLKKMMAERAEAIQGQIDAAGAIKAEAEELKNRYEASLKEAQAESVQIMNDAKDRAQIQYDNIIEKAKEDAADIVEKAGKIAENERQQIIRGAQNELMGLTMAAVSKVIGNNVDEESNRKLLDDFLAEEVSK
ncbi:MAG: F0F1 ATP synthase subunit B [Clostridia bacterium]|nr:F0F1 ATP synthase subunit B [Clostridia bacterium]